MSAWLLNFDSRDMTRFSSKKLQEAPSAWAHHLQIGISGSGAVQSGRKARAEPLVWSFPVGIIWL